MKKPISQLQMLSDEEHDLVVKQFNNTERPYNDKITVHELFEQQVKKHPDKIALVSGGKSYSYKDINEEANKIAANLISRGIKEHDIVAFSLDRKQYILSAIFGILKCGAAYMPIDLDFPSERVNYMLSDSNASFFITEENIQELLANAQTENLGIYPESKSKYCIIYTSGSTGKPKGCILTHRGIINFCVNNNVIEYFEHIGEEPIGISINNVTFDMFIIENILLLVNGNTSILCSREESTSPKIFWELCKQHHVNLIQTTPTRFKILFNIDSIPEEVNIKLTISSGEPLPKELYRKIRTLLGAEVFNPLGPSETTIWVPNGENISEDDIHIGKPMPNTQVYIVDRFNNPLPIGCVGEMCIAGDGVGLGYLNRDDLNAQKFVDNPFGEGKMYRSGDLAYWREDGNIGLVGRNDFQVKIRGLRIELEEIENAISQIKHIVQNAVLVRCDESERQLICAFYTANEDISVIEMKQQLSTHLPRYMLPHIYIKLDAMPQTVSGKINRKALKELDIDFSKSSAVSYVAPESEVDHLLIDTIGHILNTDKIGMQDNFFDLGGDSLKAIELTSVLEKSGYQIKTDLIYRTESLQELSKAIESGLQTTELQTYAHFELMHRGQGKDIFVLFPYGGGDYLSFTSLTTELSRKNKDLTVYAAHKPISSSELITAYVDEYNQITENADKVYLYSHCAGVASSLLVHRYCRQPEKIQLFYIAANYPPFGICSYGRLINPWNLISSKRIEKILERLGLDLRQLPNDKKEQLLLQFREDSKFYFQTLAEFDARIEKPYVLLYGENDSMTKKYKKRSKRFGKLLSNNLSIEEMPNANHYFQSTHPDKVAEIIINYMK